MNFTAELKEFYWDNLQKYIFLHHTIFQIFFPFLVFSWNRMTLSPSQILKIDKKSFNYKKGEFEASRLHKIFNLKHLEISQGIWILKMSLLYWCSLFTQVHTCTLIFYLYGFTVSYILRRRRKKIIRMASICLPVSVESLAQHHNHFNRST